jgi:hypothetical protein
MSEMMRKILLATLIVVSGHLLAGTLANASEITFQVSNSNGIPQAGVEVMHYSNTLNGVRNDIYRTDVDGRLLVIGRIVQGDKFVFSRDIDASSVSTPENTLFPPVAGKYGYVYNYTAGSLSVEQIVLPSLSNNPLLPNPMTTDRMRLLAGLINEERVKHGLNKVDISLVLTNAAQNYAELLSKDDVPFTGIKTHFYNSTPPARAIDIGFAAFRDPDLDYSFGPGARTGIGENILYSNSRLIDPRDAFNRWLNSEGHKRALLFPTADILGIGYANYKAVLMIASIDQTDQIAVEKARLTGDYGDPNIKIDLKPDPSQPPVNTKRNVRLKLGIQSLRGHKYRITVRKLSSAQGRINVVLRSNRGNRRISITRSTESKRLVFRRALNGRWTIRVQFRSFDRKFRSRTMVRNRRF